MFQNFLKYLVEPTFLHIQNRMGTIYDIISAGHILKPTSVSRDSESSTVIIAVAPLHTVFI